MGHNLLIMEKVTVDKEREYYIKSSRDFGWSRNVLRNQIKAGAYALSLKKKTHNFSKALPAHLSEQAEETIKIVYSLDFLGITKPVLERELEKRLINKIKHFIVGVSEYYLTKKLPIQFRGKLPDAKDLLLPIQQELRNGQ